MPLNYLIITLAHYYNYQNFLFIFDSNLFAYLFHHFLIVSIFLTYLTRLQIYRFHLYVNFLLK